MHNKGRDRRTLYTLWKAVRKSHYGKPSTYIKPNTVGKTDCTQRQKPKRKRKNA